ncbi:hypothetical protein [Desertivirga xinjiangensis]|uniref:hypothetical protein n=1 Tax=Desertivirga xinjiangensis TaxID=539206 RepID=UPI00210D0AAA|nr:hypothetical protein [Pedobacter xinjiangensis]
MSHTFHIPVLGLGFSVDTPLKVGRYGISSVISVVDDELVERMRKYHTEKNGIPYLPIKKTDEDHRARRITAYLNLLNELLDIQVRELSEQDFASGTDITRYFELLPDSSRVKHMYLEMLAEQDPRKKELLQQSLRLNLKKGSIEVNIMSKVDKMNLGKDGLPLGDKYSDALASLRGFAESELRSSIILSAGMNPRLYSYLAEFECFRPESSSGKRIVLKVSDYRSALIQAKFLAKKGLWVHEFRIESGLNCGGHAFATEGYLLGPILQEFKDKRAEMLTELYDIYHAFFTGSGMDVTRPMTRITVQGGIGTAEENSFLIEYYNLDGTGWGSPFLLVPEATNVDSATLDLLKDADAEDFYISGASPLGIPFNNFRKSTAEIQRLERIAKGRPGSPCKKKFLVSNTEFTEEPICTASREYQNLKLKQLAESGLLDREYDDKVRQITEKLCLCEGLCASAYLKNGMLEPRENRAVAICPGPNTAFFSGIYTLDEMVKHIYGKINLLKGISRPHMFINELKLYIDYLKKDIENSASQLNDKKMKQLERFREQLMNGVEYYNDLLPNLLKFCDSCNKTFQSELKNLASQINQMEVRLA